MRFGRRPRNLAIFALFLVPLGRSAEIRSLINQPVNESKLTSLAGNTHPLARPEFDNGIAPPDLRMERMLLVLRRSAEQEAALEKFMQEQLEPSSPNYHAWLTPAQFGREFGPSDSDIGTVASWLKKHGFEDLRISEGRTVIEFSGTAGKIQEAFHTAIHEYTVDGEEHWANADDPKIPTTLAPVVAGVSTLHNFPMRPLIHSPVSVSRSRSAVPQTNIPSPCGSSGLQLTGACFGISPFDFAAIYNILPLWKDGIDGTGQSVAIVAASNIDIQDPRNFRKLFGLPAKDPAIIVNGRDPGITGNNPLPITIEAVLDVEWVSAVAPGATVDLVVSASTNSTSGFDLSAGYAVNNNLAPILSASYGICEAEFTTSLAQFYSSLWQQAAAQGITVLVATGDSGPACEDNPRATAPSPARRGFVLSGTAATQYNVAVGGTDFNDFNNSAEYWNPRNDPSTQASAKGYIPETTWNDSCTNAALNPSALFSAEANCNNPVQSKYVRPVGSAGGSSRIYLKPSWQSGPGVPDDGRRDVPDVSLFAGSELTGDFFLYCDADLEAQFPGANCDTSAGQPSQFLGNFGVSISVQAFGGLMALVDQYTNSRQGNANAVFYQLAAQQSGVGCNASSAFSSACIFHDVTAGTIAMPCAKNSPDCNTTNSADAYGVLSGYDAGPGYDLATGLGSVDAFNLVTAVGWASGNTAVPSINAGGIVNAANYTAPVAPGSIASVFGSFPLTSLPPAQAAPLPPILAGLSLKFGPGIPVPQFFASRTMVNIQVPWELAGQSTSTMAAVAGGVPTTSQVSLAPFAPGIFAMNGQGAGQGAVLDANYRLVDSSHPVGTGGILQIYCTGLGAVTNQPASGAAAPVTPLAMTIATPEVRVGGAIAHVLFSGLAPGYAGLYQVNVEVPAGSSRGDTVPLVISIGGSVSNSVTIAVR